MYNKSDNLLAILGPTNTGKTHFAFEKLFTYSSGIFGFPLRLLARENYDKAVKKIGINNVALITGEEKIIPNEAKYFFCTVESMPIKQSVECVIIDEVQLAADYERGHIFTDRILNFRGLHETIFLGSTIIHSILIKLFPKITIQYRDRLSNLSYVPIKNLSKLKPRSAIIAFNINKVYEIAENIRSHKGGAAVVLGSLSPRTRNAQVDLYENKSVDYLIATDAIGMGLNLNINHVCFTSLEKFDGRYNRNLLTSEIAQIAGRAGRYKNDGSFSYTKEAGTIDAVKIKSIENHNFEQLQKIYWRNSNLNFESVEKLLSSLKNFPIQNVFIHKKNAIDEINFRSLIEDSEVKNYLRNQKHIKLLWEICRIPDFEKVFNDNYLLFLKSIFLVLVQNNYKIPEDWINRKIIKLENFDGGIPELSIKVSQIRTWTYISNNQNWLSNPKYWQEKTQIIEDNLSDNLHTSLTNKFIDSSSKFFLNRSSDDFIEKIELNQNQEVTLDGLSYGLIRGFDLIPNKKSFSHSLFLLSHVKKSIRNMIEEKIENFLHAPNDSLNYGKLQELNLNEESLIYWGQEPIGRLTKGSKIFSPIAEALNSEFLSTEKKLLINLKLQSWIDSEIKEILKPLKDDIPNELDSQVRAIAFNCFESLGTFSTEKFREFIHENDQQKKLQLSKLGIRIGAKFFFMPNLLKKKQLELNALLFKVFNSINLNTKFPLPKDGRVSFITHAKMPKQYWDSIGYICLNNFAFRIDIFEKVFYVARQKIKMGPFIESSELMNPIGCNSDQLKYILHFCGYNSIKLANEKRLYFLKTKKKENNLKKSKKKTVKNNKKISSKIKADPNSPFAVLEKLL